MQREMMLAPFRQNIAELEKALGTVEFGFVCVWPAYGLGVKLVQGKSQVVGTLGATIFRTLREASAQSFRNGRGEYAEAVSVYDARVAALDLGRRELAQMEQILDAK